MSHDNKIYKKPTKHGKVGDYRKWAKKYFKDGGREMLGVEPGVGIGFGRKRYCPFCKTTPTMTTYKTDGNGYCGRCGKKIKTYLPNDYTRLYWWLGKLPKWLWDLLDRWCLYREHSYSKVSKNA